MEYLTNSVKKLLESHFKREGSVVCPGGGPVLGGGPGGVGQPGAAAPANEAAGGVSEDVSRAVFCGEYKTLHVSSHKLGSSRAVSASECWL